MWAGGWRCPDVLPPRRPARGWHGAGSGGCRLSLPTALAPTPLATVSPQGASPAQPGAAAPQGPQHEVPRRVKRAWVIPPISVSENHKRIPHLLVQVGGTPTLPSRAHPGQGVTQGHPRGGQTPSLGPPALIFPGQIKSDKQQPGGVIYSIKGPGVDEEPLGIFSIDKFSGKVFLNAMLDREENDRYRVRIAFALDLGGVTLEDPTDLEIIVVDQNDNRPLFRQDVFTGRVVEGAEPGTCVMTVDATDADDPDTDNAALRYSILEQGAAGMFSINATTGEICTARPGLDRETMGVYNLTVQAADMSGDGLTTTAMAVIYLEDINDNLHTAFPQFSMEVEEQAAGVDVGRVFVHDKDLAGSSSWLAKFTILEGDPEGAFAIRTDPHTNDGVLSVVKVGAGQPGVTGGLPARSVPLPPPPAPAAGPSLRTVRTKRELLHPSAFLQGGWYIALVLARDEVSTAALATGTLSIEILEVNDHAPQLQPPAGVLCGRPGRGGTLLLGATDDDRPPHGAPFHFQLSPQHPQLALTHAVLAVLAELPEGPYSLPLLLRDSGTPPREQQQLLNVSVCHCGRDAPAWTGPGRGHRRGRHHPRGPMIIGGVPGVLSSIQQLNPTPLTPSRPRRTPTTSTSSGTPSSSPPGPSPPCAGTPRSAPGPPWSPESCPAAPPTSRTSSTRWVRARHPHPSAPRPRLGCDRLSLQGLEAADSDPSVPPYDTALIYDYEGSGSVASPLSSIVSSLTDEDQDYDYLSEWGPRFRRLADLYGH
uniref:Cadherin 15 n=1 Tax=Malurus cyaneus samueli TaxID=2593467 RepID=A0A8C5T2I5_9PASS